MQRVKLITGYTSRKKTLFKLTTATFVSMKKYFQVILSHLCVPAGPTETINLNVLIPVYTETPFHLKVLHSNIRLERREIILVHDMQIL
jgi:hypothetical protein